MFNSETLRLDEINDVNWEAIVSLAWTYVSGNDKLPLKCDSQRGESDVTGLVRLKMATWNVKSMYTSKLEMVEYEMERYNIPIASFAELRWKGYTIVKHHDYNVFYSGNMDNKGNGVGFIDCSRLSKFVLSYDIINTQMMPIHLSSKAFNLMLT